MAYNTSFSTAMVTTRNSTLDEIAAGSSFGGDTISESVLKTKLVFGVLEDDGTGEAQSLSLMLHLESCKR